jgi:hypothetical protein
MNEKLIEKKLKEAVKKLGGKAVKFSSPFETGWPDRLVLMPGGFMWWVELKSTGKPLSPRQRIVCGELEALGFKVWKIDNQNLLDGFLNDIMK